MPDPISPFAIKQESPLSSRMIYSGGSWFLNITIGIFVLTMLFAGGLYFYSKSLESAIGQWKKTITDQEANLEDVGAGSDTSLESARPNTLRELIAFSNELLATKELLNRHVFSSNILNLLQENTLASVQFTSFNFSTNKNRLDAAGLALSYQMIAQQITALEAHPSVQEVQFGGLSRDDKGLVSFKVAIVFKPSVIALQNTQGSVPPPTSAPTIQ